MPPTRTVPPAKAVKTERTHEENQERAYIAASRRSDRSLEARVESARRASEIHKRRTGRSLRVTEQDVVNEEMYEEEDDDLPFHYRRLTAHLQTGSADFNRRLSAYLTNHVAMRSAVDHLSQFAQYPNAPHFANNQQLLFPSPMLAHQTQPLQMMPQPSSPSVYRQAPYPSPNPQHLVGFPRNQHHRSATMATPVDMSDVSQNTHGLPTDNSRRYSMPAASSSMGFSDLTQAQSPLLSASSSTPQQTPLFPDGNYGQQNQPPLPHNRYQFPYPSYAMGTFDNNYSPLSTTLPVESQMFLGSALEQIDPLTSRMMRSSDDLPEQPFYDFGIPLPDTGDAVNKDTQPASDGLNSMLTSSALEMSQDPVRETAQDFTEFNQSQNFFEQAIKAGSSGNRTPDGTPGLNGDNWGTFIDTDQWESPLSSQ